MGLDFVHATRINHFGSTRTRFLLAEHDVTFPPQNLNSGTPWVVLQDQDHFWICELFSKVLSQQLDFIHTQQVFIRDFWNSWQTPSKKEWGIQEGIKKDCGERPRPLMALGDSGRPRGSPLAQDFPSAPQRQWEVSLWLESQGRAGC